MSHSEVFTKIHINYIIKEENVSKEAVERAIQSHTTSTAHRSDAKKTG